MLVGPTGDRPACPCVKTALTAYPFGSPEFNLVFSGTHDFQSLVFCVLGIIVSIFIPFLLVIILSVLV